jgi:hypothetical protein
MSSQQLEKRMRDDGYSYDFVSKGGTRQMINMCVAEVTTQVVLRVESNELMSCSAVHVQCGRRYED